LPPPAGLHRKLQFHEAETVQTASTNEVVKPEEAQPEEAWEAQFEVAKVKVAKVKVAKVEVAKVKEVQTASTTEEVKPAEVVQTAPLDSTTEEVKPAEEVQTASATEAEAQVKVFNIFEIFDLRKEVRDSKKVKAAREGQVEEVKPNEVKPDEQAKLDEQAKQAKLEQAKLEQAEQAELVKDEKDGSLPADLQQLPNVAKATTEATLFSMALFDAVNEYRLLKGRKDLLKVPLSTTMTRVAQAHVTDLLDPNPELPSSPACNPHSWITAPHSCCYDGTLHTAACMWDKPSKLSNGRYKGAGFEILMQAQSVRRSPAEDAADVASIAVAAWARRESHRAVILNQSPWDETAFQALGCGVGWSATWAGKSQPWVAVCWFGTDLDSPESDE
jgi:hypothetical protein